MTPGGASTATRHHMDHHRESGETKHHHRGKSSERPLDKDGILSNLGVVPGQVVLDAGSGHGYMARAFGSRVGNTGKGCALDPDPAAVKALQAESAGPHSEPVVGDITRETPLPAGSIDLIHVPMVIHGFSASHPTHSAMASFGGRAIHPGGIGCLTSS